MSIKVELSDDGRHAIVTTSQGYDPAYVGIMRRMPSRTFVPRDKGGPHDRLQLDLAILRLLRARFGSQLVLGPRIRRWGRDQVRREAHLTRLSRADDANLERVPNNLQWAGLAGEIKELRPYQRADIAFMAATNVLNANQPGAGKTAEIVLSLFEANLQDGFHLIAAPLASLSNVWEDEIMALYESMSALPPTILTGNSPNMRRAAIAEAKGLHDDGYAFWLVINPAMVRVREIYTLDGQEVELADLDGFDQMRAKKSEVLDHPELAEIDWTSFWIDEFHLMGLSNPQTLAHRGAKRIATATSPLKLGAASGTPMKGKVIKLWGGFNFIDHDRFRSKWRWAETWLDVKQGEHGSNIEGIRVGLEDRFEAEHAPYMVRRTKREVLPGLPPKNRIEVWCGMSHRQAEQYRTFATEAEWRIDDQEESGRLTVTNVLDEYTRLKQFADSYCDVQRSGLENKNGMPKMDVSHTGDSGKLEQLWERLAEESVFDPDVKAQCLIYSQFNGMIAVVGIELAKRGINFEIINGGATQEVKDNAPRRFQAVDTQVLLINTLSATAMNLSRADSAHLLDETWVPDEQEQAEDRAHRGDPITMAKDEIRVYYYRTTGTIEEHIQNVVKDKALNNRVVLDLIRMARKEGPHMPAGKRATVSAPSR